MRLLNNDDIKHKYNVKTLSDLSHMRELIIFSNNKNVHGFYFKILPRHMYMRVAASRWGKIQIKECLAIAGFCRAYGDCYLIVPEQTFARAMNTLKDKTHKKPRGIWAKTYPYVKINIEYLNKYRYKIMMLDKWNNELDYNNVINTMKEEFF